MRKKEPRIIDPANHPRRAVGTRVAAEWLGIDEKTMRKYLGENLLTYTQVGSGPRRIDVSELVAFKRRNTRPRVVNVPHETGNSGMSGNRAVSSSTVGRL